MDAAPLFFTSRQVAVQCHTTYLFTPLKSVPKQHKDISGIMDVHKKAY